MTKGAGSYAMTDFDPAKPEELPMRRATSAELRQVTEKMHFDASDGVVLEVPKGTPNMPALPIGLYKGRDEYRDTAYFFFGFLTNGKAKRIACK